MISFYSYLLEAAACLTLFMLVYRLFLHRETFFQLNRFYLIGTALLAWVIPLADLPSPFFTRALPSGGAIPAVPSAPDSPSLLPLLVYGAGAGLMLVRFALQLRRLRTFIQAGTVLRRSGRCRIVTGGDTPPFSFFGTIFINRDRISDPDLARILAHEAVHVRQFHSLDILLMELVTIFQWFNPFVWPYRSALKEIHEYLADRAVIAQGGGAGYRRLILEQHIGGRLFEFANNLSRSQIKRRITMMTKEKSRARTRLKVLLAVPAAALLLLAFAEPRTAADPVSGGRALSPADIEAAPVISLSATGQDKPGEQKKKQAELEKKKKEAALAEMEEERRLKIRQLKLKLKGTEDPELRKKIKALIVEMETNGPNGKKIKMSKLESVNREMEELKLKLEKTGDADLRKKIKMKLIAMEEDLLKLKEQEKKNQQAKKSVKKK